VVGKPSNILLRQDLFIQASFNVFVHLRVTSRARVSVSVSVRVRVRARVRVRVRVGVNG
jgi:hypothetical protein